MRLNGSNRLWGTEALYAQFSHNTAYDIDLADPLQLSVLTESYSESLKTIFQVLRVSLGAPDLFA